MPICPKCNIKYEERGKFCKEYGNKVYWDKFIFLTFTKFGGEGNENQKSKIKNQN